MVAFNVMQVTPIASNTCSSKVQPVNAVSISEIESAIKLSCEDDDVPRSYR
jgi:hypothetical protein